MPDARSPKSQTKYVPGVCNIGKAEIRRRKAVGQVGLVATLALAILIIGLGLNHWWRLLLFFPAMLSTIGYLQAAWHFCAKFGLDGVFNFGADVGQTDTIEQAEYRRQDRRTALLIIGISVLVGVVVAVGAFCIPIDVPR